MLFCGKSCCIMLASVGICLLKEPKWVSRLLNHSFNDVSWKLSKTALVCLLLFLLTWLCKCILNVASCVISQKSLFSILSCVYFLLFLAVDHMHASSALSLLSFWLFCHWGICLLLAIGGAFASSELNGLLGVGSGTTPSCTAS